MGCYFLFLRDITLYIEYQTVYKFTMSNSPESFLAHYGISLNNAFLPPSPVQKLQDPYYAPWEDLAANLPAAIEIRTVRDTIDNMPILSPSRLKGEGEWRRAYVVLAFLTHGYIWGGDQPKDVSCLNMESGCLLTYW